MQADQVVVEREFGGQRLLDVFLPMPRALLGLLIFAFAMALGGVISWLLLDRLFDLTEPTRLALPMMAVSAVGSAVITRGLWIVRARPEAQDFVWGAYASLLLSVPLITEFSVFFYLFGFVLVGPLCLMYVGVYLGAKRHWSRAEELLAADYPPVLEPCGSHEVDLVQDYVGAGGLSDFTIHYINRFEQLLLNRGVRGQAVRLLVDFHPDEFYRTYDEVGDAELAAFDKAFEPTPLSEAHQLFERQGTQVPTSSLLLRVRRFVPLDEHPRAYLIPGGLVHLDETDKTGRPALRIFTRQNSNLLMSPGQQIASLRNEEGESLQLEKVSRLAQLALLGAWLSPLEPPTEAQLSNLRR